MSEVIQPILGEYLDLPEIVGNQALITDETGVSISSDRLDPPQDIDFLYMRCPFPDSPSRNPDSHAHEIPMSGLEYRRLQQSYPRILRLLLATREAYLAMNESRQNQNLLVIEGLDILDFMQYLPSYLVNRNSRPVAAQGVLPQHLVVGSNSASGAIGAIGSVAKGNLNMEFPTGNMALESTEQKGSLVGLKTICVASPKMITNFLNLVRDGSDYIKYGNVETETNGLVAPHEFERAVAFGTLMEMLMPLRTNVQLLDIFYANKMSEYNPRKHNARRGRQILNAFNMEVAPLMSTYQMVLSQINLRLGRQPLAPGKKFGEFTGDEFELHTLELAKTKNVFNK